MSGTAIVTMIVILGFVWGGFILLAVTAVRKEREKTRAPAAHGGGGSLAGGGNRPEGGSRARGGSAPEGGNRPGGGVDPGRGAT